MDNTLKSKTMTYHLKTKLNNLTPIYYNITGFPVELNALHYPQNFMSWLKDDFITILKKNPLIRTDNVAILMPTSSFFEKDFKEELLNMYLFRIQHLRETSVLYPLYIEELFIEYLTWLDMLKQTLNEQQINVWTSEDHHEFMLYYNRRYFPNFIKDYELKKNILKINPFIHYWYNCNSLRLALNVPITGCFLPCAIASDDTIQNILNRLLKQ